jgi:hypothetical protein
MRAMNCDCGEHLEAPNDEVLFERARAHVDRDHPEMQLSDDQVRELVSEKSYEAWASEGEGTTREGGVDPRGSVGG